PAAFVSRPGFFGWLQSALRDRVGWRSVAYLAIKLPWTLLGAYVAFSLWWDAVAGLLSPIFFHGGGGSGPMWGLLQNIFLPNGFGDGQFGFGHSLGRPRSAGALRGPLGDARLRDRRQAPHPQPARPRPGR